MFALLSSSSSMWDEFMHPWVKQCNSGAFLPSPPV